MKSKLRYKLFVAAASCLIAIIATAAVKGDQQPFAKYGVVQVAGYDAGSGAPQCLGVSNQNAIMVRNYNRDGGTGATLYCGFDTSVSANDGMPVAHLESLSVDLVSLSQGTPVSPTDGGTNAIAPKLCCIGAPGASITDLRWMVVK